MPRGRKPAPAAQPPLPPPPDEALLRQPEVVKRVGIGKTALWQMIARGEFPKPRKITGRAVGWLASEITAWITTRPQWQPD